jgi:small subunit ribosomal protein S7
MVRWNRSARKAARMPSRCSIRRVNNVKPVVEVKSRRVGGANYQVPVEVRFGSPDGARDALAA